MKQKPKQATENSIKAIRLNKRILFSAEQKLVILMEAKRGEYSITALCLKHSISKATFNRWNKDFKNTNRWKIF